MIKENTVTPNIRIMEAIMRSEELTGVKSPKPMVDKVVMAKYQTLINLVKPVSSLSGYPIMAVLKVGFNPYEGSFGLIYSSYYKSAV